MTKLSVEGGVTVNTPDSATLLREVADRFAMKKGFSVATLNLDHVVKLRNDSAFLNAYLDHTHVTADGNPIVWMYQLAGQGNIALVPGSEAILPVAEVAASHGVTVALVGATEQSLQSAATALEAQVSGLKVVLCHAPEMGFDPTGASADKAIDLIAKSGARLVFLALGAPKQEIFASRAQTALPEVGFLSIGAGLDFISGAQVRAPMWVRKIAAEWIWRMLSNPKRLARRYGACLVIFPGLAIKALKARRT